MKANAIGTKYAKAWWACATYIHRGKHECAAKRIPEGILKEKCAEALGLAKYDPAVFTVKVAAITIPADGVLVFTFKNGTEKTIHWEHRSRRANVRVIPAIVPVLSAQGKNSEFRRRVAAYARVSTDSDEQLTSYEAQVDYYTKLIQGRTDWEFIRIYTDEGISAVNTKRREGFKQMVADGLSGKFDLLVTKSVSRFARNTVDSLTTVCKLKEVGCEVWFEKENICTLDSKGELLITIIRTWCSPY